MEKEKIGYGVEERDYREVTINWKAVESARY